jgi:2'-5' RNA ligase
MSPLPGQFTDRWRERPGALSFQDAVCWHVLLGGQPTVRAIAKNAQQRLAGFGGLHLTPMRWLHITVLLAGPAAEISQDAMQEMLTGASSRLSTTAPVTVTLSRVSYHPEAIVLGVSPASALSPIFEAAQAATREVTGARGVAGSPGAASSWAPHLTLCYSTTEQPAAPVIAALGKALPACEVTIDQLSLVVQNGPEPLWDWHPVGAARLLGERQGTASRSLGQRQARGEFRAYQGAVPLPVLDRRGAPSFGPGRQTAALLLISSLEKAGSPTRRSSARSEFGRISGRYSSAAASPGTRCAPPMMNRAASVPMRTSLASAMAIPAPAAGPFTALTTGTGALAIASTMPAKRSWRTIASALLRPAWRSWAPAMSTQRRRRGRSR